MPQRKLKLRCGANYHFVAPSALCQTPLKETVGLAAVLVQINAPFPHISPI